MSGSVRSVSRNNYKLLLSAVGIGISAWFVVRMSIDAWEDRDLVSTTITDISELLGGIDALIMLSVGLYLGWLGLFLVDESKNIQAIFILLASVIGAPVLAAEWAWIDWGQQFYWALIGAGIALLTGGGIRYVRNNVPREFPRAGKAILWTLVLGTVIAFIEVHVAGPGVSITWAGMPVDLLSTVVFAGTAGHFLTYSHRQDIFVLSSTPEAKTVLMAELFDYTRAHRQAKQWGPNAAQLNRAITDRQLDRELTPVTGGLHLRFRTQSRLSKWVSVVTDSSEIGKVTQSDIAVLRDQSSGRISLPSLSPGSNAGIADYITGADVVVFLFETSEVLDGSDETASEGAAQVERFSEIYDIIGADKEIIGVAIGAEAGLDAYEEAIGHETTLSSRDYESFLRQEAFGRHASMELVPVGETDGDGHAEGIDELVEKLEA